MEIISTSTIEKENIHVYWNDNNKTVAVFKTNLENTIRIPIQDYTHLIYHTDKENEIKEEIREYINSFCLIGDEGLNQIISDLMKEHRKGNAIDFDKIENKDYKSICKKVRSEIMKTISNNTTTENINKKKNLKQFNDKFNFYEWDWFQLLDNELYDYVDNTTNVFKAVIIALSALFGYTSRIILINGGSEVGKSEYIKTIKKLMPHFENLGSSTPASMRRSDKHRFNKKIIYLGDKGLKGKSQSAIEELEGLYELFGQLVTEGEFKRDVVDGKEVKQFKLESDGICVFYSEPYTNLRKFGAGDQYTTRSTYITVNPVKNGLEVALLDENKINEFYSIHKNYIEYILKNPLELNIDDTIKTEIFYASKESLRTYKFILGVLKGYCQYMQIEKPSLKDVKDFLKVFIPKLQVTDIEFAIYQKLYNNLNKLTKEELEYKIEDDGSVMEHEDMLVQRNDRKNRSFFTAKQIKTYFRTDFKKNRNLKDTLDDVPYILNNLFDADLIEKLDWQFNGQNVYYIPYNKDMEQ